MEYFLTYVNSSHEITAIIIRTIIIFLFAILVLRIGFRRFNLHSPIDFILPIVIGSLLSRGMNGSASLVSTITASTILIILHWIISKLTFLSPKLGKTVKGVPRILMKEGQLQMSVMAKYNITLEDLCEELRYQLQNSDISEMKEIRLERTGRISFIRKE